MAKDPEVQAECPSCGAAVALDAPECPRCGELFEEETPDGEPADAGPPGKTGLRERLLLYLGIGLILLGGPGIALGSWLHDVLRIPYADYDAYEAFGPVNRLVTAVGLIVLIVGIVFLILSLRMSRSAEPDYDVGSPRGS